MQKHEKQMAEVDKLVDVLCDRCGKSCLDDIGMNHEYAEIKATWGYGSNKDCQQHKIEICEKCYDEMISTLGIKPQVSHYL